MEAYIAPAHYPSEEEFSAMKIMFFTKDRRTGMFAKHLKQLQPDVNLAALPAELEYKSKRGLDALPAADKHKSKNSKKSIGMTDAPSAPPKQGRGQPQAAASSPTPVAGTETLELSGTLEDMLGQLLENPVSPNPLDLLDNTCSDAIASPHVMQSSLASPPTIDKATNMPVSEQFGDKYFKKHWYCTSTIVFRCWWSLSLQQEIMQKEKKRYTDFFSANCKGQKQSSRPHSR